MGSTLPLPSQSLFACAQQLGCGRAHAWVNIRGIHTNTQVCASPYLDDVSMSSQDSGIAFFHVGLVLADDLELESHEFCCQQLLLQLLCMTIKS